MTRRGLMVALAASVVAMTGCSAGDGGGADPTPDVASSTTAPGESAPATSQPPTSPTAEDEVEALDAAELTRLFSSIEFPPGQYTSSIELFESVYPGLAVSDLACLTPFGVEWEQDVTGGDGVAGFATSADRSMTAVVVSATDPWVSQELFSGSEDAVVRCSEGEATFLISGAPVEVRLERTEPELTGADQALGWTAAGDVDGASFELVGITAQVGGSVVALVGWEPTTSSTYVPMATQMIVDGL